MSKLIDPKDWDSPDVRSFEDRLISVLKEIAKELKNLTSLLKEKGKV